MNNTIKICITAGVFAFVGYLSTSIAEASGAYGSNVTLITAANQEVHETVDAGAADLIPHFALTAASLLGLGATSVLIKKTK